MDTLTAWIVAVMVSWSPPAPSDLPRYESIAADLATAAVEAPLFSDAEGGAERTLIYLAAVSSLESFFNADVDAFRKKGDGGRAHGLFQVHLLPGEKCETRMECIRIGRERIRLSWEQCSRQKRVDQLSHFMTGHCMTNPQSRFRMYRAEFIWKKYLRDEARKKSQEQEQSAL